MRTPAEDDDRNLTRAGYVPQFRRGLGSFAAFAAGFSYLSILTGIVQNFHLGYREAGPAFFWTWPAVFAGQFCLALCFAELARRHPLCGGVYAWAGRVGSPALGWFIGWVYLASLVVTLAAVALAWQVTLPAVWPGFQVLDSPAQNAALLGVVLIALSTAVAANARATVADVFETFRSESALDQGNACRAGLLAKNPDCATLDERAASYPRDFCTGGLRVERQPLPARQPSAPPPPKPTSTMPTNKQTRSLSALLAAIFSAAPLAAQTAPSTLPAETVQLSPFEVTSSRDTGYTATTVNLALHMDGKVDATGGHAAGWAAKEQHGYSANANGLSSCKTCHGTDLTDCTTCHTTNGHAGWRTECTFCHGTPGGLASPPVDTAGLSLRTNVSVGAHAKHAATTLTNTAIGCTACHAVDAKLVGPGLREVAKKYAGRSDAAAYLAGKIRGGGSGVWGAIPMPPQSLAEADAQSIAQWLADGARK